MPKLLLNMEVKDWDIFNKIAPSYSSPYSAYLHMPFIDIMCFSPERFLSYDGKIVETKPIKGTRPVSSDPKKNERAIKELSSSDKEKAENEDAYNEVRLQMHNKLIKKLRSLKKEWKLDNISQVTERIILAFFKNDLD